MCVFHFAELTDRNPEKEVPIQEGQPIVVQIITVMH